VPLVILCAVLALISIAEHQDKRTRHVDLWGAALAAVTLAGLCLGLIEGPAHHWSVPYIVAFVIGVASFGIFLRVEARRLDPMLPLRLFHSRNFSGANITTFAMYGALGGFFFALVIYLQTHLGYSSLQAGASLLPVTVLMMLLSGRMGALAGKRGSRGFMTAGPLLMGIGVAMLIPLQHGQNYALHVFPGILLFGLGLSVAVAPLTSTVMSSVQQGDSGIASGVNNAVARVASLLVVALLGLLGAANTYKFSSILCAILLIGAGALSFIFIRNQPTTE
jgi:predicted MFS family arabinose efflux permease